jgi:hypothetical protein
MYKPLIYVSTYAKYKNHDMSGYWVAPSDFSSRDDFYDHCKKLHSNEEDPKLRFYGGPLVPDCWTTESSIDKGVWDWLALPEQDQKKVAAYLEEVFDADSIGHILDNFVGAVELGPDIFSREKMGWMYSYLEDRGFFEGWSDIAKNYFNLGEYLYDHDVDNLTFVEYMDMMYVFTVTPDPSLQRFLRGSNE